MATTLRRRADGLAIASFICSLFWIGGIGAVIGIILGHLHRAYAQQDGQKPSGLATAGLVLGYLGLLAIVITLVVVLHKPDATQQWITCEQNTGGPC